MSSHKHRGRRPRRPPVERVTATEDTPISAISISVSWSRRDKCFKPAATIYYAGLAAPEYKTDITIDDMLEFQEMQKGLMQ